MCKIRDRKKISLLFVTILSFMFLYLFAAQEKKVPLKAQLLSPEKTTQLLKQHERYAIAIGNGKKPIYAFIDPLCEMSQLYVQCLYSNKGRLLANNRVYLFLYHLDGKPSKKLISTILESEYPEALIKQVMVEKQSVSEISVSDSEYGDNIQTIATLAETIGVYKRPYIVADGLVITGGE